MGKYHESAKEPIYGNCIMLAPDGQPLSRCNAKKVNWYMSRNLADLISEEPLTIRLKFEPSGRTDAGDPFLMADKESRCVCCGSYDDITRHHIVPYCFRKHLPDSMKTHNSYDIAPLCVSCHHQYEHHAFERKKEIAGKYGICVHGEGWTYSIQVVQVRKHARPLLYNRDKLPPERVEFLLKKVRDYCGKEDITNDDLERVLNVDPYSKGDNYKDFGMCIVEKVENIEDFIIGWRKHFLECMNPQYLSPLWDPNRISRQ